MRITREIIAPGHRWRAIDDRRMARVCKDLKKIISDFLGPQITRTQASIRKYIDRECNQCSGFTTREQCVREGAHFGAIRGIRLGPLCGPFWGHVGPRFGTIFGPILGPLWAPKSGPRRGYVGGTTSPRWDPI